MVFFDQISDEALIFLAYIGAFFIFLGAAALILEVLFFITKNDR